MDENKTTDPWLGTSVVSRSMFDALSKENRALRQALTWCVVNDGETLFDHPKLLERFREILGMEHQP